MIDHAFWVRFVFVFLYFLVAVVQGLAIFAVLRRAIRHEWGDGKRFAAIIGVALAISPLNLSLRLRVGESVIYNLLQASVAVTSCILFYQLFGVKQKEPTKTDPTDTC